MKTNYSQRPFKVLLVEDNDDDVLLTRHAFKKAAVPIQCEVAKDGREALQRLRKEPPYDDAATPDIILLDLNMPRMDGRQLLAELKRDEQLRIIPTIILTTSAADDDVTDAYSNYANSYMIKPMELSDFAQNIAAFVEFWFNDVATLPPHGEPTLANPT
jgi:CheY-like chemotaxis protein